MPNKKGARIVAVELDEETARELHEAAHAMHRTKSALVRAAIRRELDRLRPATEAKRVAASLAKELTKV
jgi:predicted transcriptional regulator